jgi:alkylhydroperoxidase family enzyme
VNTSFTNLLDLLESLDDQELRASICFAAGREVDLDAQELNEALRRALVVRAVGGDPTRELAVEEDAVARLADELASEARSAELQAGLDALRQSADGRAAIVEAVASLEADPENAWRTFCAALLADEIGRDE